MKVEKFILSIIKKIETLKEGVIAYSYLDKKWYCICLNDFDLYVNDTKFKVLSKAWHKAAKALGIKIVFVYSEPKEEILAKLADEDNLFLSI